MSTSILYHAFGVRSCRYLRTSYKGGRMIFDIEPKHLNCPGCGARKSAKVPSERWRHLNTVSVGRHPVYLNVRIPRIHYSRCSNLDIA